MQEYSKIIEGSKQILILEDSDAVDRVLCHPYSFWGRSCWPAVGLLCMRNFSKLISVADLSYLLSSISISNEWL
jgi:hypothetical protein